MNIDIVRTLPHDTWHRFVEQHPAGNVFHTPEMFQVFDRTRRHRPVLWAAVCDEDIMALLLPVLISLRGGLGRYFTTRAVAYGGVLSTPGAEGQQALKRLLTAYERATRGEALFTELRHTCDVSESQFSLRDSGFTFECHLDYLINLDLPVEQVWKNMKPEARSGIGRVQRQDSFAIEELDDRARLPLWYALIQKSYSWAHVPLADYSLFESAFDVLHPKGMARFTLGRVRDQYVAASVELPYKDKIYAWYRGFDRQYASYRPNDLMVWHILKWGAENGYRVYDFGGAGRPNAEYGPRVFKAKFGGELVNYGRSLWVHAPIRLKLSTASYQLLRKVLWPSTSRSNEAE